MEGKHPLDKETPKMKNKPKEIKTADGEKEATHNRTNENSKPNNQRMEDEFPGNEERQVEIDEDEMDFKLNKAHIIKIERETPKTVYFFYFKQLFRF